MAADPERLRKSREQASRRLDDSCRSGLFLRLFDHVRRLAGLLVLERYSVFRRSGSRVLGIIAGRLFDILGRLSSCLFILLYSLGIFLLLDRFIFIVLMSKRLKRLFIR